MKRHSIPALALTVLFLMALIPAASASFAQKGNEKSKGGNNQVKLYSNAVEIVDVKPEGEKCGKEATTLRLRVVSESPVDVRVHFRTRRGGWAFSDYLNKKKGEEMVSIECQTNAKYKVQARPVGSSKWPSL
jgi:hypothetical protein